MRALLPRKITSNPPFDAVVCHSHDQTETCVWLLVFFGGGSHRRGRLQVNTSSARSPPEAPLPIHDSLLPTTA